MWNLAGELIHAGTNYPGSWNDSKIAAVSGLYCPLLEQRTLAGYAIIGDSTFPQGGGVLGGKLLGARKANEHGARSGAPRSMWLSTIDILLQRALPSERQSAEWGVRALKGPFGKLTTTLAAEAEKRKLIIACCAHLYNLRTRKVELNQLRTVYSGRDTNVQPWITELL